MSFGFGIVSTVDASRLGGLVFPVRLGTEAFGIKVCVFEEARLPLGGVPIFFGLGMVSTVEASRLGGLVFPVGVATEAFGIRVSVFEEARLPLSPGLAPVGMKKDDCVLE